MVRVYVICEGQTEETFIKEVLYDLCLIKSIFLQPVLIGKPGHLLFSDCRSLALAIGQPQMVKALQDIRDEFSSPEDINDSYITAPSKRLRNLYPGYDKPIHGSLASLEIGIDTIRKECKLFDRWLQQIEALQNQV
jgi:Domain of unknown function (DUF4276)